MPGYPVHPLGSFVKEICHPLSCIFLPYVLTALLLFCCYYTAVIYKKLVSDR